jgi:predicted esterase YcpF (UPF0227 family)
MLNPVTHLLYLHGFRSSPQSAKARLMAAWLRAHRPDLLWWCPQLPPSPHEAMQIVRNGVAGWPTDTMAVIGSSLGGFYAAHVAAHTGCRAVFLNPAVRPDRDLAAQIGQTRAWHSDAPFRFRAVYVDELRALGPPVLTHPERCLAVIAKGDEVLDWREMLQRCAGCQTLLLEGGDHALSDFEQHLPRVLRFLGLLPDEAARP